MGRKVQNAVADGLKGDCCGIFSRNISGGDAAPMCDGIYVSERPDGKERNLLACHRNHCARFRPVAQHGKEGTERSGREGIFKKGNPAQGKWGLYFKPLYHFVRKKGTPGEKCALTVNRG